MAHGKVRSTTSAAVLVAGYLLLASASFAIGSGKESEEEKATKNQRKAVEAYNDGVNYLEKARFSAQLGDSAFAYNYRATSDAKARKSFEKAVSRFKDASSLDPTMKEAFNNLGYAYRKLGKLEESLTAYQTALAIDSNFAQAREYLGETFLALDQLGQATEQYNWLATVKSPYADTLGNAIKLYKLQAIRSKMNGK